MWRDKKADKIRDFRRLRWSSDRNAAERSHQPLLSGVVIGPFGFRQSVHHSDGGFSFDPARCNSNHADALRANFLGQAFVIV